MSTPGYPGFGADPYAQGRNPQTPGPAGAPPVTPGGAQAHPGGDQGAAPQDDVRPRPGEYVPQSGDLFAGDGFDRSHDGRADDRRPFATYAQVPVDPYALAAAAPLGTLDDPHAPRAASAQPARPAAPPAGAPYGTAGAPAGPSDAEALSAGAPFGGAGDAQRAGAPAGAPAAAPLDSAAPAAASEAHAGGASPAGAPFGGAAPSHTGEQPASGAAQGSGPITFVPGITQDPPASPAGPAGGSEPHAPAAYGAPSGQEAAGVAHPDAPAAAHPEPAGPAHPEPAGAAHPEPAADAVDDEDHAADTIADPETAQAAELVWDDGTAQRVDGRMIVGRNPATEEGATVAAVRDETLSLSKTHFEIDAADDGVWLIDRHSTNGVTIVRGEERIAAVPGERTELLPGDALEMGDRVATFRGRA